MTDQKLSEMSKQFQFVNAETGRRHHIGGCIPSGKPSTSPQFSATAKYMSKDLPLSVDLREFMTPVENQDDSYSCVANALAAAYEFLIKKNTGKHIDISRLFIYYNSRIKDGLKDYNMKDEGTQVPHAIEALAEFGCCKEQLFPYNGPNVNHKPPMECYEEAKPYRIKEGMQLRGELDEMKACLAEGYPFVFCIVTFRSFHEAATNGGRVPIPNSEKEGQNEVHGCHAMLATGYSDRSQCFMVQNSWGADWGDKGYCFIPYDYMCNTNLCFDVHSIKTITDNVSRHQSGANPSAYDEQWFWKPNDSHDYYHSIWKDKSIERQASENDSPMSYILWMDSEKEEIAQMTKHLGNDPRVRLVFQETFALSTDYLLKNLERIKSLPKSSIFQIVCRGYYAAEKKNAIDLLPFLKQHKLEYVPIVVITGDKPGVLDHFKHQAPAMGIHDWRSRIYVTNSSSDLITKINANLLDQYANRHH